MLFGMNVGTDYSIYARRRQELWTALEHHFPECTQGCIILPASCEVPHAQFRQDSNFYYFTGIQEPACVLMITQDGLAKLFVPQYSAQRSVWVHSKLEELVEDSKSFGIESVEFLGSQIPGFQATAWMPSQAYTTLSQQLQKVLQAHAQVFAYLPTHHDGSDARILLDRLMTFVPELTHSIQDISPIITTMRRSKDMGEIESMSCAVELTILAQEAAANAIKPDVAECEVQGQVDYIFTASGARAAFPTIVASGQNSTVLHYTVNGAQLESDDLIIIDCGAEVEHYCGDLSRTYPVSGKFTSRQKELYNIVLELQEYIAKLVKPGYWINNPDKPEQSLNHLAKNFLAKKGLDKYFVHGISHYLGLDVHDIGNVTDPLEENDMITIEPGIYIPDEKIGIRIEDDYWITKKGAICLSEALPKKADDIEAMMRGQMSSSCDDADI